MDKSPFYIVEEFVSPLKCEDMIDLCDFNVPDTDIEGHPIKTRKTCEQAEMLIYERLQVILDDVQSHYGIKYRGTERMNFEWYPTGAHEPAHAENSEFVRGKWLRTRGADLTGILFLSDYQDDVPFESDYEVYGGKLEFPQHLFGFNPTRGTLVIFPSAPHFINATAPIHYGDLYQVRFNIVAQTPFWYNPSDFPGNYTTWFKPLLNK